MSRLDTKADSGSRIGCQIQLGTFPAMVAHASVTRSAETIVIDGQRRGRGVINTQCVVIHGRTVDGKFEPIVVVRVRDAVKRLHLKIEFEYCVGRLEKMTMR